MIKGTRRSKRNIGLALGLAFINMLAAGACAADRLATDTNIREVESNRSQEVSMSDGRITFEEYEQALNSALECAKSKGVQVSPLTIGQDGVTLDYSVYEGDLGPKAIDIFDKCYNELAHAVDLSFQTSPEVTDARSTYLNEMAVCLYGSEQQAIDVHGDLMSAVLLNERTPAEYLECQERLTDARSIVATVTE